MKRALISIAVVLLAIGGLAGLAMKSMKAAAAAAATAAATADESKVRQDDLVVKVVETGTIDAEKAVEVKGLVTGRLSQLLVDEGDTVKQGDLIAVIDPRETRLLLLQNQAQLRGARSGAEKTRISVQESRLQVKAAYEEAQAKLAQMQLALKVQPTLTTAAIEQAQMSLDAAKEEKSRLADSAQPIQMETAVSAYNEATANLANAQADYVRQVELEKKGYVSGKVVENAQLALDLAKTRLDSAKVGRDRLDAEFRAELIKAQEQIDEDQAALDTAKANSIQDEVKRHDYLSALADLERARAGLRDPDVMEKTYQQDLATISQLESVVGDAERQLNETDIRAPISGIVTKKELNVGELATGLSQFSSGTTIVRIEDRKAMRVNLDVNEIDVAKLRVGMPAQVEVDALPTQVFHGTVTKIAPASKDISNSTSGSTSTTASTDSVVKYEVEIMLKDASRALRSGMSAKCTMKVIDHPQVLLLPLEFVGKDGDRSFVQIPSQKPGGQAGRKYVTIGAASGSEVEILTGVQNGTVVQKPTYAGPKRKGAMQFGNDDQ